MTDATQVARYQLALVVYVGSRQVFIAQTRYPRPACTACVALRCHFSRNFSFHIALREDFSAFPPESRKGSVIWRILLSAQVQELKEALSPIILCCKRAREVFGLQVGAFLKNAGVQALRLAENAWPGKKLTRAKPIRQATSRDHRCFDLLFKLFRNTGKPQCTGVCV